MEGFKKLAYMLWGNLLFIILLLSSINVVAFNLNYYKRSFAKYNIGETTNMDMANFEYVIKDILNYLEDSRRELNTKAIINGRKSEVFGDREKVHMMDVKVLFNKGRILYIISIILFVTISLILIIKDKYWKISMPQTLLYTSIVNVLFLIIFLLLIKVDFDKYFTYFHLVFFDNDLWLLDPSKEILILLVPEQFFYSTAIKIILYFAISSAALGVLGLYFLKRNRLQYGK